MGLFLEPIFEDIDIKLRLRKIFPRDKFQSNLIVDYTIGFNKPMTIVTLALCRVYMYICEFPRCSSMFLHTFIEHNKFNDLLSRVNTLFTMHFVKETENQLRG